MRDAIPIVRRVDVLILGGSSGAVAAGLAAAKAGRSVFLAGPRPYLGEDIAAAFDYWPRADDAIETDLARAVFAQAVKPGALPGAGAGALPGAGVTPMHVKRTLEQALVAAGVSFLLNTHPAGVLRDGGGRIAGAVLANRAGRQVVDAGQVIDATERGLLARQAGVTFTDFRTGEHSVEHVTIGGETIDDLPAEALPAMRDVRDDATIELPARRYRLTVDLGDGGWDALAEAYASVARRCWRPGVFQQSERLIVNWPDAVAGEAKVATWSGARAFPVEALEVEAGLHVLGAAARVDRDTAAKLARPAHLMTIGERLGEALAAAPSAAAPGDDDLSVQCAGAQQIASGSVRTLLGGLRPMDQPDAFVDAPANHVPVLGRFDVVVIGGGTGGAPAGIAAGRAGARTLVCENLAVLGGVGTAGQIARYYFGNIVGFTAEVDAGCSELETDEKLRNDRIGWSPPAKQAWQLRASGQAGVQVRFATVCCGAWVVDGTVRGVVIAGPGGFGLVEAGAVVDASGNADVAAAAGARTLAVGAEHVAVQGVGLASIMPGKPYHNTDHNFSDDTDPVDATAFLVSTKLKYAHGFDLGQLVDSRERRQIVGDVTLTPADFLAHRRFPDTICVSSSNFDTHGFIVHPLFMVKPPDKQRQWVDVPYRCLLPAGLDGLLVTGLGVSAHRDAIPVIRMQADVQNQGYAAGLAAAMAAAAGTGVRDIDVKQLQQTLVEIGNLPDRVLTDADNFPVDDARLDWAVRDGWDDYEGLALLFSEPDRARPRLRAAYDRATDADAKLRYALVLGLMGDAHGAPTLAEEVADRSWDEGWNYRGMGQFGMSMSPLDAMLTALGRCGDEQAWPAVLTRLADLPDDPAFSHCRAVAEACEGLFARHPNDAPAPALAAALRRPGMAGHAQPDLAAVQSHITPNGCENDVRNRALRELHLARALYRCGDADEFGRRTLEAYADDLRGHFARHARAVLAATPAPAAV